MQIQIYTNPPQSQVPKVQKNRLYTPIFRKKAYQRTTIDRIPINIDFYKLNEAQRSTLNQMIGMSNVLDYIYPTQSHIAKKTGYSRKQTNISLNSLRELNLVDYNYRHLTSCEYQLSSYFNDRETRNRLVKILPNLWYLPISWIRSSEAMIQEKVTQYNNIKENIISEYNDRYAIFEFNTFHKVYFDKKDVIKPTKEEIEMFAKILDDTFDASHNYLQELQPILKLTPKGIKYLQCYPIAALCFALERLAKATQLSNGWAYFDKLIRVYCSDNVIKVDYSRLETSNEPFISEPIVSLDKAAVALWLGCFNAKKAKQLNNQTQPRAERTWAVGNRAKHFCCDSCLDKYCCGSCEINKTHGALKVSGGMQLCDKLRTSNLQDSPEMLKQLATGILSE